MVNSAASLGNGGTLTVNGGTLAVATGYTTSRNLTLGSASGTIQVDPAQTYTLTGVVSGSGALTKSGTGTLTLTGANTYTGQTVVDYGTLTAAGTGTGATGALATTTAITVNGSGTLLLGASNQINDSAPITLNGGTIAKGDFSEGSASAVGLGALTLSGPGSNLDFGTGAVGILSFASFTPGIPGDLDVLTIANWTGVANTIGSLSTDRLIFNGTQNANLAYFSFTGYSGATQFSLGNNLYEVTPVTPVPEPTTYAAAALAAVAVVCHLVSRRRRRAS